MMDFYVERDTLIHRAPAGLKLLCLCVAGAGLFLLKSWPPLLGAVIGALALSLVARLPIVALVQQLRSFLFFILIVFLAQLFFNTVETAVVATLRLMALLLLAILMTLTTRPSEIVEALERALAPFSRWIAVEKVSLAISLALRFIPVLARMAKRRERRNGRADRIGTSSPWRRR